MYIYIYIYYFFFLPNCAARTFRALLSRSWKNGHPCHVSNLRGKSCSFSSLIMILAVNLSYINFLLLRYISSIPTLLSLFMRYWILSDASLHLLRWSYNFYLSFVKVVYHIDWFAFVEAYLHLGNEFPLIMMNGPLDVLLNLLC